MTAALNFDLLIDQYADFSETFLWNQGPTPPTAAPVSLVGCTAKLMVRSAVGDASPLISISTTASANGSIAISTPAGGTVPNQILVSITNAAMSAAGITAGLAAFYDLLITFPSGAVVKFAAGNVRVGGTFTH